MFVTIDKHGLCDDCTQTVQLRVAEKMRRIATHEHTLSTAQDIGLRLDAVEHLIALYREFNNHGQLERRFLDVDPDERTRYYETIHDVLIIEKTGIPLPEKLATVESALSELSGLYFFKDIISRVREARTVLSTQRKTRIISLINHKGGVGKTTSTINLGAALAEQGKNVLLVDFDPQANLSDGLGIDEESLQHSIYDSLVDSIPINTIIRKRAERLSVAPATILLTKLESFPKNQKNAHLLEQALQPLAGFDYILIDCPPSIGLLTLNALIAAQEIIIPMQPEYFALKGIRKLLGIIELIRAKFSTEIIIRGILITRYDARKRLHNEVIEQLEQNLPNRMFSTRIRENIALAEASSYGQTIFEYGPTTTGAGDYLNLGGECHARSTAISHTKHS